MSRKRLIGVLVICLLGLVIFAGTQPVEAQDFPLMIPRITLEGAEAEEPRELALTLQILVLLTILSLAPAILVMVTSFTRIVVAMAFVRQAIGSQQIPPTPVLIGMALFLTFFVMAPVFTQINQEALQPYLTGEKTQEEALEDGVGILREFMFTQTSEKELALMVGMSGSPRPTTRADIPTQVLIPAFILSELRIAFTLGFLIYVPFLIIDMVVASILMSMGMMMLPPIIISLPFKILLFVLVDGWNLITRGIVLSFR